MAAEMNIWDFSCAKSRQCRSFCIGSSLDSDPDVIVVDWDTGVSCGDQELTSNVILVLS